MFSRVSEVVVAQQFSVFLEVCGDPKPGNVMRGKPFLEISHDDFLQAAASIEEPLEARYGKAREIHATGESLSGAWGSTLLAAALASVAGRSNTIFGTLLVEVPLAIGAVTAGETRDILPLAAQLVEESGAEDALALIESARACRIGGLQHDLLDGAARRFDITAAGVADEIRKEGATLLDLLSLSAPYDLLSRELTRGYTLVRENAPRYVKFLRELGTPERASSAVYCGLLSSELDTLVARKAGEDVAEEVRRRAREAMKLGIFTPEWVQSMGRLDLSLRSMDLNPGTLADLTAASIFAALLGAGS